MALRDTTWVYDASDTVDPTYGKIQIENAIKVSRDGQTRSVFTTGGSSFTKQDETAVYEWICLSKAAADAAMTAVLDTTNWTTSRTFEMSESNRILGSYTVTMTEITRGAWA